MSHRFFSAQPISDTSALLSGEQAHHLIHVMRFKEGDQVTLFDGSNREFTATIVEIRKQEVVLNIDKLRPISRELNFTLSLAVALPKGDRQRVLVEKLVELGVSEFIPLKTRRGVALPSSNALLRLSKHVIAASQQCGRNRLMQILQPASVADVTETHSPPEFACFLADPSGEDPVQRVKQEMQLPANQAVLVAVGPEGGFESSEIQSAAQARWRIFNIGPTILRTETAAIVAATVFGVGR